MQHVLFFTVLFCQVVGHFALLIDIWTSYLHSHKEVSAFLDRAEREIKDIKDCLRPVSAEGVVAVGEAEGERLTSLPSILLKRIEVSHCHWTMFAPVVLCFLGTLLHNHHHIQSDNIDDVLIFP